MRILKKLVIYATLIGVVTLSILVAFSFLYQDQIIAQFTQELDKQLKAPIHADKIEFSVIQNFPHGTVTLYNVYGMEPETYKTKPDTLFKLQEFSFDFNVIELYNSNFDLENVTASKGFCRLKINKKDQANFDIIQTTSSDTGSFLVTLNKVQFNNVDFLFHDATTAHKFHFFLAKITAKGMLSDSQINVALYGSSKATEFVIDHTSYIQDETVKLDVGVEIDTENKVFQVSRGFVTLRDVYKFDVKGKNYVNGYDFTFKANNLKLAEMRTMVPNKYMPLGPKYKFNGTANTQVTLRKKEKQRVPFVGVDFQISKASFVNLTNNQFLDIPVLEGQLNMGAQATAKTASLHINNMKVVMSEGTVQGEVHLKNLLHPQYKVDLGGKADLKKISDVFAFDNFEMEGFTDFDLNVHGVLASLDTITNEDIKGVKGQAKLKLNRTRFQIADIPLITVDSGALVVNQQKAKLSGLVGTIDGARCTGWIWADNWLNYSIRPDVDLRIAGNVDLAYLNLPNWQSGSDTLGDEKPFSFTPHIYVDATARVNQLTVANTQLSKVAANVKLTPTQLKLKNIKAQAYDGALTGDFRMTVYSKYIGYQSSCAVSSVDVTQILKAYNNFGQKVVTSKHLEGDLSFVGDIRFKSDRNLTINEASLVVDGDVVLVNGIIHENKLLTDIPKEIESDKIIALFINLSEFEKRLHHIKFDTIQNHLTIANSTLTIPHMDIRSSAIGISVEGTHTFSNELDYYMTFNLNEVLSKRKLDTDEYGFIEDDKLGRRLVYLHVYTYKGEIQVEVDKLGKKKRANKSNVNTEVNKAKGVLKQEFGLFKSDTTVKEVEVPEPEFEYEVDFGEFDTTETATEKPKATKQDTTEKKGGIKLPGLKPKKKKTKEQQKQEFEEWEFDDDDY